MTLNMKEDGMRNSKKADWAEIEALAGACVDPEGNYEEESEKVAVGRLLAKLEEFGRKHGRDASVLATIGDYTSDRDEQLRLYLEAFDLAVRAGDELNQRYVSSSLVEYYLDGCAQVDEAKRWLAVFAECLDRHDDDFERECLKRYEQAIRNCEQLK